MRKTLILIVALFAAFVFSACERVSAHSPPFERQIKHSAEFAAAAETPASSAFAETRIVPLREYAVENKLTAELSPALRSNRFNTRTETVAAQKVFYDLPPERFAGFGFDNNARAKI